MKSCHSVSGVGQQHLCYTGVSKTGISHDATVSVPAGWLFFSCAGLVLNPDLESESEDSEPDGPDDPVIPSPETDDVKGESFFIASYWKVGKCEA